MTVSVLLDSFTGSGKLIDHVSDSGHTYNDNAIYSTAGDGQLVLTPTKTVRTDGAGTSAAIASPIPPTSDFDIEFDFVV